MEAVPRLPMICFDLKVSHENASFGPKLKQYIADFYREDPETYNNEIYQLEGLRSAAVRPALDLTGCAALKRYFCQLKALQSRFPMNKGQPSAVTFAWRDLFANIVCTLADIRFEIVCVLYNIGALHCKLGAEETRTTPDSMKAACTHFQSAAWAFQYLREHYPQPSGIDLSPEVMKLFQDICLAQAQECILEKSMLDNRKPSIVNAIGMQALVYYRNALQVLELPQSSDMFQENVGTKICHFWIKYLSFKVAYMSCVVYLFQGMQSEELQKMGERVSFYQAACDKLQEARKLSKGLTAIEAINETLTYTNDIVEGKRKAAKNENEFIYHEEVPDKDSLVEPKPASLAKGIPINFSDSEVSGPDIFNRLIPMGAHEASSVYSEEKAKLLRKIIDAVDSKDVQLNEFMSSLQLDQLNGFEQSESLPQGLIDRCAALSVKTDVIQNLVESMNNLSELHIEVENILVEIRQILQDEDKNEKEYQKIMGNRQPSIVSTELSREGNKYLDAHNKANESNQTLQKAMTLHLANLKVLILPLTEIQNHIPSLDSVKESIDHSSIAEMKMLVGKVYEMQNQRKMLVDMLREAINSDDITAQLLTRQGDPLDEIFKQEIEKHNKQVGIIEQNLFAQENILKALTDAYAKYAPSRKIISDVVRKRETSLSALMTSYDTYEDLMNKLLKGLEFYRKLSANVKKLHARVKSTCKVQEEERSQLLATHTTKQSSTKVSDHSYLASTLPKDHNVSTTPKLKDFLPFMKNKTAAASSLDSTVPDSTYAGQMYPPYVRPAPVGSEGTNEPPVNYSTDPSSIDNYASYQYNKNLPTSAQYSATQYNQYDSQYGKPDASSQAPTNVDYYQKYDAGKTAEYNPSNLSQYYSSVPGANYGDQYNYNTNMDVNYQTMQTNIQPDQYANPNYSLYNPSPGADSISKTGQLQNPNLNQMMENMSISSSTVPSNTYNPNTPTPANANASSNIYNTMGGHISQSTDPYSSQLTAPHYSNMYNSPNPTPPPSVLSQQSQNISTNLQPTQSAGSQPINPYVSSDSTATNLSPYHSYHQQGTQPNDPNYNQYGNNSLTQSGYNTAGNFLPTPYSTSDGNALSNVQYPVSPSTEPPSVLSNYQTNTMVNPYVQPQSSADAPLYNYNTSQIAAQPLPAVHDNLQNTQNASNAVNYTPYTPGSQGSSMTENKSNEEIPIQSIQSHVQPHDYTSNYNQYYYDPNSSQAISQPYSNQMATQIDQNTVYSQQLNTSQNYPNYVYNAQTNTYEYINQQPVGVVQETYISQNQTSSQVAGENSQKGIYTSAGTYGTVQTSSNNDNLVSNVPGLNTQYYSVPYGQQNADHSNLNKVQYTMSDCNYPNGQQSSLTYSSPYDNKTVTTISEHGGGNISSPIKEEQIEFKKEDDNIPKTEPSTLDLLSGLDFSIDHQPLKPEIKVPPVSEHVIRKIPSQDEKINPLEKEVPVLDDDVFASERPPKRDIFAEPSLLNGLTQEVKSLQSFVDGFTKKTHSGITMLDSKWKKIQDAQAKDNAGKSTKVAKDNLGKNASPDVLPFDDTRVVLKGYNDDDYINASHVKRISPWAVPMVVSDLPIEENYGKFWHMIFQEKISIIVCLLTEIELQGKFYGPMTKNHKLQLSNDLSITLSDIKCNVNWTKRKLIVNYKTQQQKVTHYQINVFPARIVSAPLVLLVDKVLKNHEDNVERDPRSKILIHCSTGAGRSSLIILLTMVMCQVRAGYIQLKEMLDSGFLYLCGTRTNVLEDTKYLVDIYRTVLFFVQGVLCSGTVMFSGEAVSVPSGASVPPQHIPSNPNRPSTDNFGKFSRESFEEMKQAAGLKSGDMKDPLSYLDPLWSLKKRKE